MNDYPQPERGDPPDPRPEPPPSEGTGERSAFAVHRDPSLTATTAAADPAALATSARLMGQLFIYNASIYSGGWLAPVQATALATR